MYNGLDTRVGSTTNSVARSFLRDGAYVTDPVLTDGAATYTPGVSERRGTATTYQHSGLKNADAQSSPAQLLTGTRQYDAFGNLATSTGTWQGPFGYAGAFGYQEDPTGLKLLGHRLYDASTGRFLTRDPIKDGRNLYVYCDSDPISRVDYTGLSFWHWGDERWVEVSEWYGGTDVIGPGGEPVRVGGWPSLFNLDGNAITVNETVHLNDYDDYEDYVNNKYWSDHERVHIDQETNYHRGNAVAFLVQVVVQYVLAGSHDGSPYEGEADAGTTSSSSFYRPTGIFTEWAK